MIDVGEKKVSRRWALARCLVNLPEEVLTKLRVEKDSCGKVIELFAPKGPIFNTAIIAGTMALKRTAELIPHCHQIQLDGCRIEISLLGSSLQVECSANSFAKTGVEMEALLGATVAGLTVYDMCKSFSHNIVLSQVSLLEKRGGKSDVVSSFAALILAGGRSKRMGKDKALINYFQKGSQLERLGGMLKEAGLEVFLSCSNLSERALFERAPNDDPYSKFTQIWDLDEQEGQTISSNYSIMEGPLRALISGLKKLGLGMGPHQGIQGVLVTAIDLPYVQRDLINYLIMHYDPSMLVTAFVNPERGWSEPLFAIYRRDFLLEVQQLLAEGKVLCPRKLLAILQEQGKVRALALPQGMEQSLTNVNTPEERDAILCDI
ncbi:MAG: NTP transferase domain-containing protein [Oligoflexia bacterium]|nr:NTP transferase domain-containing protein [Oligoflexia bacterium]